MIAHFIGTLLEKGRDEMRIDGSLTWRSGGKKLLKNLSHPKLSILSHCILDLRTSELGPLAARGEKLLDVLCPFSSALFQLSGRDDVGRGAFALRLLCSLSLSLAYSLLFVQSDRSECLSHPISCKTLKAALPFNHADRKTQKKWHRLKAHLSKTTQHILQIWEFLLSWKTHSPWQSAARRRPTLSKLTHGARFYVLACFLYLQPYKILKK